MGESQKKSILIVDDTETALKSASIFLKGKYDVSLARSGKEALDYLKTEKPDLILLDIEMPDMDGYELMSIIQNDSDICSIPVVFLTAKTGHDSEIKGLKMGAMDYITKPFVPEVLLSRIEKIIQMDEVRRELDKSTKQDSLTGLWNRTYMQQEVERYITQKGDVRGTFMMMDLDNFKGINDHFGHIMGDTVLVKMAETLKELIGEDNIVCRIGGDEFACFIKGESRKEELRNIAEKIIDHVEKDVNSIIGDGNDVSASVGLAVYPHDAIDFLNLYNKADKALYFVKQNGKRGCHFYQNQENYTYLDDMPNTKVDMQNLKKYVEEKQYVQGAYQVKYDGFRNIYQFVTRCISRTKQSVQLLLFTLSGPGEYMKDDNMFTSAFSFLEGCIVSSLRRGDVATRFSSSQFVVILMDTNRENGEMVANRIMNSWDKGRLSEKFRIQFDMEEVQTGGQNAD